MCCLILGLITLELNTTDSPAESHVTDVFVVLTRIDLLGDIT